MIMVTNSIRIKKGHVHEVAKRFQQPKAIHKTPGFLRMQILITKEIEEYDELKVCTTWENEESFEAWTTSNSFKSAHTKRQGEENQEKIMLGSSLSKFEVAFEHEKE
ncbi:antibiotic biosynthesis monooxygenase [Bacillus sp. 2205SS5-2]|uniref:antibiotic biosynthesis monooxygenase n=1 Tax=Bacillus sp. 2205SS5-2 TaxID=3109031 RepID=UPI003007A551